MDLQTMSQVCERECGLNPGRSLVVGVSGGADSLALVDCLAALGYPVMVAHFNHRLRDDSQSDLEFVRDFAKQKELSFVSKSGDVAAFACDRGLSIEEAARQMRYEFLFKAARECDAQALAVGHTADDQVETILMHMLRGAGLDGMKGMLWRGLLESFDVEIPLVRPLLGVWRVETESWCRSHNLSYRVDTTNSDTTYKRNRLRQEIIPLLESYSPQARAQIHRMAGHLAGDQRVLALLTKDAFQTCQEQSGEGYLVFNRERLAALDPALTARVIRLAAFKLVKELRDFDSGAVERCLEAVMQAPSGWQADLPGGLRLRVTDGKLYLMTWHADLPGQDWPNVSQDFMGQLICPGELTVGNGWLLRAETEDKPDEALISACNNTDPNQAWIDVGLYEGDCIVKRAPAGQRFSPLGMVIGSQKLSDFWVNVHLPQQARAGWPVVYCGGEPAWLPGFRLAQQFRLTEKSQRIIHLRLMRRTTTDGQ
jgi:tRNA(Ile)-lysidine synthase